MIWTQAKVDAMTLPYTGRDCRGRNIVVAEGLKWPVFVLRIEDDKNDPSARLTEVIMKRQDVRAYLNAWRVEDAK